MERSPEAMDKAMRENARAEVLEGRRQREQPPTHYELHIAADLAIAVISALREKANEFYGAMAREPDADAFEAWRHRALCLDGMATHLAVEQRKAIRKS